MIGVAADVVVVVATVAAVVVDRHVVVLDDVLVHFLQHLLFYLPSIQAHYCSVLWTHSHVWLSVLSLSETTFSKEMLMVSQERYYPFHPPLLLR